MALLFCDSFDHYDIADILKKWTDQPTGATQQTLPAGRFGNAWRATPNRQIAKTLPTSTTLIVGMALRVDGYPASDAVFLYLRDGTTNHVDVRLTPTGTIRVTRNGTSLGLGTYVLSLSIWYYIEFKATISDSGSFHLKINGVDAAGMGTMPVSADTRNAGNASVDNIWLSTCSSSGIPTFIDDVYVCDGTGGAPTNDFLGDVRVEALFPNGNGNSSQFDGSDGNQVDNYLLVDETSQDGDTTYVESADLNDKDTYAYTNLATSSGTIYGVQVLPYLRKTSAGSKAAVSVARLAGGTEEDSAAKLVLDSYSYQPDIRTTKPGGGAWTIADVNGAEFGIKVNT